jgi:hypothetical protein
VSLAPADPPDVPAELSMAAGAFPRDQARQISLRVGEHDFDFIRPAASTTPGRDVGGTV